MHLGIGYYNNQYYIKSGTGYYYILDNNFNRILEPTKMSVYGIGTYGIMSRDDSNSFTTLYSHNLENKKELSYKLEGEPKYFIDEIKSTNNSSVTNYFNLNTQEKLVIYK